MSNLLVTTIQCQWPLNWWGMGQGIDWVRKLDCTTDRQTDANETENELKIEIKNKQRE